MQRPQRFSIWYFIAAFTAVLLLQDILDPRHTETLPYSEFKQLLRSGALDDVAIAEDAITGTINAERLAGVLPQPRIEAITKGRGAQHGFLTARVNDPQLVEDLDAAKVRYAARIENKWLSTSSAPPTSRGAWSRITA